MRTALRRRLDRLERRQGPPLRQRIIWWNQGDPEPVAKSGEQLIVLRWTWDDDDVPSTPDGKAR